MIAITHTRLLRGRLGYILPGSRLHTRSYSENSTEKPRSGHSQWYTEIVPAMIPIFLLGSAVYLGLQLAQLKLSHEKFMEEAESRVKALEAEVDTLQAKRTSETRQVTLPSSTPVSARTKLGWW